MSVRMVSRSPTQRSWLSVAAREIPPRKRWAPSRGPPITMAAAPEPRVREANWSNTSTAVAVGWRRRSMVASWVYRLPSPSTISTVRRLARLDGHGPDLHGVDEAEAGVAEVVVDALGAEAEVVVDRAGHARLEVVLADRGRDQEVDLGRGARRRAPGPAARPWPPPRRR